MPTRKSCMKMNIKVILFRLDCRLCVLYPHTYISTNITRVDILLYWKGLFFDKVGLYSSTPAALAARVSHFIAALPGLSPDALGRASVITDVCAGCGRNTASFVSCCLFSAVNAMEVYERRSGLLVRNIKGLVQSKRVRCDVSVIRGSYNNAAAQLQQDVVFMDVPWDSITYKKKNKIRLYVGKRHVAHVISDTLNSASTRATMYVVVKVLKNFDYADLNLCRPGRDVLLWHCFRKFDLLCILLY